MIQVSSDSPQQELGIFCQRWLSLMSSSDFESAASLIDAPNSYGLSWDEHQIFGVLTDYFDASIDLKIDNEKIENCAPSFFKRNDGGLPYEFNLPVNGELTDLTVQFEFNPRGDSHVRGGDS